MRTKFVGVLLTGLAAALLGAAGSGLAGDKGEAKGDAMKRPDIARKEAAAQQIATALALAEYGRKEKSPEALLVAARILAESLSPAKGEGSVTVKEGKAVPIDRAKTVNALIAEATKIGGDHLAPLVKQAKDALGEKTRSPVAGQQNFRGYFVDVANTGDNFIVRCKGGEWTGATLTCFPRDPNCDLDLEVYDDQTGKLVAQDRSPSMNARVSWFAPTDRNYRLRVVNFRHTQGQLSRCNYALTVQ